MSHEYDTCPAGTWVPIPQTENQFHEDIIGPATEVVESPPKFQYARGYGQIGYDQPMLQVLPTEEIMSYEYYTWPAGTSVLIPQTENQCNEDFLRPTSEVVEPPAKFEYASDYEQPIFRVLVGEEVIIYEYGTWPAGTRVSIA